MLNYTRYIEAHPNIKELDPDNLPKELSISTMTGSCKLPVSFNVPNIAKYLPLSSSFILGVKCGNSGRSDVGAISHNKIKQHADPIEVERMMIPIKKKSSKKKIVKKSIKNFYNQATIVINSPQQNVPKGIIKLNIKVFKNGAFQFTGCKKISYIVWALDNLLSIFNEGVDVIENGETVKKTFAYPQCFLHILNIYKFRISMINSNFVIGFMIDREKVFNKMIADKYDCSFDPARHAGVHVRYTIDKTIKPLSIFIFDKGSIIITGARTYLHIMECYKFINTYLLEHYDEFVQKYII